MRKNRTDLRRECGPRFAHFQFLLISYIEADALVIKRAEEGQWEEVPLALLIIYLLILVKNHAGIM